MSYEELRQRTGLFLSGPAAEEQCIFLSFFVYVVSLSRTFYMDISILMPISFVFFAVDEF